MHRPWLIALVLVFGVLGMAGPARAVTPDSPEVVAVINRALALLEQQGGETRLGGKCLIGLCMLKNGRDASHPRVVDAVTDCQAKVKDATQDNYSVGLAIIFLCELDVARHRALAEAYLQVLLKRQQGGGGWGYPSYQTGDTSQVQYATLGLWTAEAAGLQIPQASVDRLGAYLVRTQDPSGAWGYQAVDPGKYTRVNQPDVRHSLAAGGLGSLYICADLLGFNKNRKPEPEEPMLPPALRPVDANSEANKRKKREASRAIDPALVERAMADGNAWFDRNFKAETDQYNHYYLYAYERYRSYRELVENKVEREPEWYNQVFDFLQRTQKPNGGWQGQTSESVDTAFSVLCLSRSSKKAIQKLKPLGEGHLLGGMGLPASTADLQERDGKVLESPLAGSLDEMLAIIEDPDNPQLSRLAAAGEALELDGDVTKRSGQIVRLRALVSAGSFESRLVAVRTLGKVRDFDNVPVLLYALTDPDVRIVRAADKGLRFISRKFGGVGLPEEPMLGDLKQVQKAWKDWFLSVRPDAELLD